jgi:hypothetical protein
MTRWDFVLAAIFLLVACTAYVSGYLDGNAKRTKSEVVTCTRCRAETDKPSNVVYKLDGKSDIMLCRKCVYEQAESFIKFCPVE